MTAEIFGRYKREKKYEQYRYINLTCKKEK